MTQSDLDLMESVVVGEPDSEIAALEALLRRAQLSADVGALDELLSDELLFAGPDGQLATKAQDLSAHASGVIRFVEHEPEELRIRRLGASVAIASLRARLVVEVAGKLSGGVYRYTRVWHRDGDRWRVAGGHVSEVHIDAAPAIGPDVS